MATHAHTIRADAARNPSFEMIDLTADAHAALVRLCALLGRLQSITAELEDVASSMPARTMLARRMKELTL